MRWRLRKSLVKALEPSSRAARRRGPKQRSPAASNASVTPTHERRFGPDDRQVDALAAREVHERCDVVRGDATFATRGSSAVPALPGAT